MYTTNTCAADKLHLGCKGPNVGDFQHLINIKKIGNLTEDNDFGSVTDGVLKKFQTKAGVVVDGIPGAQTRLAISDYTPGLTLIGTYTEDRQDTEYSCGASALKMALSIKGLNVSESLLMQYAGTSKSAGTSVSGMIEAIHDVNKAYNKNLNPIPIGILPWTTIQRHIRNKTPVLARIQSYNRPNGGQHWEFVTGINIDNQTVRFGDPSFGVRITSLADFKKRLLYVIGKGVYNPIIVIK